MQFDKKEVALAAMQLRKKYDVQSYGIPDIFSFVNQQDIELIRYPFGKDTILGFSTLFEGKKIIVSNSSEILTTEIYTVAHELGHIIYDFTDSVSKLKLDINSSNYESSISEERAYYFADCLLMPEGHLRDAINLTCKKDSEDLLAINIVKMQLDFKVSFAALVKRMLDLKLISSQKKDQLYKERDFYTSKKLFSLLGTEEELLNPAEKLVVPPQYIDFVMSNYKNQYIPLSSLKKSFELIDMDVSELEDNQNSDDNKSFDDIWDDLD